MLVFQSGGIHTSCEVDLDNLVYTFDATTNVIYDKPIEQISDDDCIVYVLPQVRNLDFLIDKSTWKDVVVTLSAPVI